MRNGHEKANRNDKARKPHYWELWLDEENRPPEIANANSSVKEKTLLQSMLDSLRDVGRPRLVVANWTIAQLLEKDLIGCLSSEAGRYEATFETSLVVSSRKSVLTETRTIIRESGEIAMWITRALKTFVTRVKDRHFVRCSKPLGKGLTSLPEIIGEFDDVVLHLGTLFAISDVLELGRFPVRFMESDAAKEPSTHGDLRIVSAFLQVRRGIDFYLQRPEGRRYLDRLLKHKAQFQQMVDDLAEPMKKPCPPSAAEPGNGVNVV